MALITKGLNDFRYDSAVQTVAKQLLKGQCVFFLGAGASIEPPPSLITGPAPGASTGTTQPPGAAPSLLPGGAADAPRSLPTGRALSQFLAGECKLDWHDYIPLSTIAFYYESYFTRQALNDLLISQIEPREPDGSLRQPELPPSSTIRRLIQVIAALDLDGRNKDCLTVTTNYDRHFERAYKDHFKHPLEVLIYRGGWNPNDRTAKLHCDAAGAPVGGYWAPRTRASLYKIHGCISQVTGQSLVVTEEDYINFLTNALGDNRDNRLPWFVGSKLETSTILFLGYSLADWNFRTIFKATVERRENKDMRSYAVQFHEPQPSDRRDLLPLMVDFWGEKRVDIVNVRADEFVTDLLEAVQAQIAALETHGLQQR